MIGRNTINNDKCKKAATVLRLADYGKNKNRTWMRTNGIQSMRDMNEKNMLDIDELKRARYAYYAETLKFLPGILIKSYGGRAGISTLSAHGGQSQRFMVLSLIHI